MHFIQTRFPRSKKKRIRKKWRKKYGILIGFDFAAGYDWSPAIDQFRRASHNFIVAAGKFAAECAKRWPR